MSYRLLGYVLWPVFWFVFPLRLRVALLIMVDTDILVVNHRIYFGKMNLPGGGVKLQEKPAAAAIREAEEELGLKIKEQDMTALNSSFSIVKEYGLMTRQKFYIVKLKTKPEIDPNREIESFKWTSVNDENIGADARQAVSLL